MPSPADPSAARFPGTGEGLRDLFQMLIAPPEVDVGLRHHLVASLLPEDEQMLGYMRQLLGSEARVKPFYELYQGQRARWASAFEDFADLDVGRHSAQALELRPPTPKAVGVYAAAWRQPSWDTPDSRGETVPVNGFLPLIFADGAWRLLCGVFGFQSMWADRWVNALRQG